MNLKKSLIAILLGCILAVFINEKLEVFFGPFIAVGFAWLYFGGYKEFVVAAIVVANDALGTIVGGAISYQYLLLALAAVDLIMARRWRYQVLAFLAVSAVLLVELLAVEFIQMRHVIFSFAYILGMMSLSWDEDSTDAFFRSIAMIVCLIGIHACVTGGVEFYEYDAANVEYVRKGILGVGIGDANYSGFLLNIGLVCLWCDKKARLWLKCLASVPMLYAVSLTLSTSTLLALLLMIVLGAYIGKKQSKALGAVLIVACVLIAVWQIYIALPKEMHLSQVDAYILRMEQKLNAYQSGNLAAATTGRSDITAEYWRYIFSQPVIKMLFGGNTLNAIASKYVPHNAYIDLILQVGFVGALCILSVVGVRFMQSVRKIKEAAGAKRTVLLKILALFFATNLSLAYGSVWAVWMIFLLWL